MSAARLTYSWNRYSCTFQSTFQSARMKFRYSKHGFYLEAGTDTPVAFECGRKVGDVRWESVDPNSQLLRRLFDDEAHITIEKCVYESSAANATSKAQSAQLPGSSVPSAGPTHPRTERPQPLDLKENEKRLITEALRRSGGDEDKAAKQLGISERALMRKVKDYNLQTSAH